MNQPLLFATEHPTGPAIQPAAKSRRTDPPSSKEAAEKVTDSGATLRDRALIAAYVHSHRSGVTAGEIAQGLGDGWTNVRVSRRIQELIDIREVKYGPARKCRVKTTTMQTIWPVE